LKRLLRLFLATTIVAAIQVHPGAAAVSEDIPIPGGTAAVAAALGIHPVPDRGRFLSEVARLLYGLPDRRASGAEAVVGRLRQSIPSTEGAGERVPVPLTAAVWSDAVFHRRVAADSLALTILSDRRSAFLCYGLAGLDDETLQYLVDHPGVLTRLYTRNAAAFAVFSSSLHVRGGRVAPPGGDEAIPLWEAIVGEKVTRPDRFVSLLFAQADGRTAYLYDTIGHLDRSRQRFALGLWIDAPARLASMRALAVTWIASLGGWRLTSQPFARQPYDAAAMLMRVSADASGRPTSPASRSFWSHVFEGADLPDDPARTLRISADDRPIEAAWLVGLTSAGDSRVRAERLDQFALGQRVFAGASVADMPDALVALRAFRRYHMLMVTLERIGIREPALYAAAARVASRMSPPDPVRAFVATTQFEGALALLLRMRLVGTIDAVNAEALVASLVAVPLNSYSQYLGGILRWLSEDLRPAIRSADTMEAAVLSALSGAEGAAAPSIEWEGQRYRLDLAAAERRRLERVREKQSGPSLDLALDLAAAARRLTSAALTLDLVRAVNTQLKAALEALPATPMEDDEFPPGVAPPPNPRNHVLKAIDDLGRLANTSDLARAPRAAVDLVDAADEVAAQTLVSLAYAVDIGDPDGAALLSGDVSRRHDFGFGLRDSDLRLGAAWAMPRQDVASGVPWHVDGSLLGLDVALATLEWRRLSSDRALEAPTLTANERDTFAAGFGLMNPYALSDTTRDAVSEAIERGRHRVLSLKDGPDVEVVAGELDLDGWRRRALAWTRAHEPERLESLFALSELAWLGDPGREIDLDPWGASAIVSMGCMCTRMPSPGRLPMLMGRPQIGLLATAVPDLNLHIARMLKNLRLPARLAKYVLSAAVQDFIDEVRATDSDDWLTLVRTAAGVTQERIEDYVAAAAADGPLVPDRTR